MKQPKKHWRRASTRTRARLRQPAQSVPTPPPSDEPDQPFAEGAADVLGPDLRHRLISEAAFHHLAERGFEDGSEVEDWSQSEDEVDHTLIRQSTDEPGPG